MANEQLDKVYGAQTADEQQAAYDDWAAAYERDIYAMGYRLPAMMAAVFAAYVPRDAGPILDAGCGGGAQAEALAALGYGPITGIDLSEGMLAVAREKSIYSALHQATLGQPLSFADNSFAATLTSGTITPGHAPPETYRELIRVTRPGGLIISSLRADPGQLPAYLDMLDTLEAEGKWRHIFSTPPFQTMPYGEPEVENRVHVHEVLP